MDIQQAISKVIDRQDLTREEMTQVVTTLMQGEASPAQVGGFLVGMQTKGASIDEIIGAVDVMRRLSTKVNLTPDRLVDTCGTGGDGANTFNISTTSALVAAAAGVKVAKHGNRSVSSCCGSADLLEAAGVYLTLMPEQVEECVNEVGIGFMFAPSHHSAMKYLASTRRELGVRTFFNLLGPLTNPASALCQVVGVYSQFWLKPFAEILCQLGSRHVLVVHAEDGLDEISIGASTQIAELVNGGINCYSIVPEDFGYKTTSLDSLRVSSIEESLEKFIAVLDNESTSPREIVCLNAGAAIYVAGLADGISEGVHKAEQALADGSAKQCLRGLVAVSNRFKA